MSVFILLDPDEDDFCNVIGKIIIGVFSSKSLAEVHRDKLITQDRLCYCSLEIKEFEIDSE